MKVLLSRMKENKKDGNSPDFQVILFFPSSFKKQSFLLPVI